MSTTYYLVENECACCGRSDRLELGLQSAGWQFVFRQYPDQNIFDFGDWLPRLIAGKIENEARSEVTLKEFLARIYSRRNDRAATYWTEDLWGYQISTSSIVPYA